MEEVEEVKYPYLGKREYKGHEYVVMFTDENYGVVVMSDIEGNEALQFGQMGEFDEKMFTFLEPERCVRLSN